MLDPMACAGMATIGPPCVSVSALLDLHHLLIERGFRRSSQDDPNIVQEEQHEESARTGAAGDGPAPTEHGTRFGEGSGDELLRAPGAACPAGGLLMEAAGAAVQGNPPVRGALH
jgi:hypothetical protein